jgi:hypothetical protein
MRKISFSFLSVYSNNDIAKMNVVIIFEDLVFLKGKRIREYVFHFKGTVSIDKFLRSTNNILYQYVLNVSAMACIAL